MLLVKVYMQHHWDILGQFLHVCIRSCIIISSHFYQKFRFHCCSFPVVYHHHHLSEIKYKLFNLSKY